MNHKELVAGIATKANLSKAETERMLDAVVSVLSDELIDGKTVGFQSFGAFEVRKKEERLSVHPSTQIRTLIPPKLVVNFKQSNILKEKLKENSRND
ncbi:MAG: HU family DNA-binding protein [Paludibacter sp.]|nr:HU family DNA-binding protein [Paludibacter sp.]